MRTYVQVRTFDILVYLWHMVKSTGAGRLAFITLDAHIYLCVLENRNPQHTVRWYSTAEAL